MKFKIFLILVILFITSCEKKENKTQNEIVTVQEKSYVNPLYYSGTIEPIATRVVPSPAEGVVIDMAFQYGDVVNKDDSLFKISSTKFLSDYKNALLKYVKSKNDFTTAQNQLSEAKFLHKNQLIADDEYKAKQSAFYAAQLTLLQDKDGLAVLLKQMDIKNKDFYNLTIADTDKITQAISMQMSKKFLRVQSPSSGIILSSIKNQDDSKKIRKGDVVKEGDVLAIIGDMRGLAVKIKVSELTINQIKIGDKVKVTGIAFPDSVLQGEIKQIDRQGEASMNGLPTFPVIIEVPTITEKQQKAIHVGMSAKVEIDVREKPEVLIPFTAIHQKEGSTFVTVHNEKTNQQEERQVMTGKTTRNNVAILDGLKVGEKIVIAS